MSPGNWRTGTALAYGGTTAVVIIPTSLVITDEGQVPAVTATRYALRRDAPVPALSGANGHDSDGHALNGNGSNGHLSNGGTDLLGIPQIPGTAAAASPDPAAASAMSDDSSWWARPTLASDWAAESIHAAQEIGSATEVVPDSTSNPAPTIEETGGLPVRVRQASLAPQLREGTGGGSGTETSGAAASAEAIRSTLSAMQRGWELGRSVAGESPHEPASHDPGTPRHRANHEGA